MALASATYGPEVAPPTSATSGWSKNCRSFMTCGNAGRKRPVEADQASTWLSWGCWSAGAATSSALPRLSAGATTESPGTSWPSGAMTGAPSAGIDGTAPTELVSAPVGWVESTFGLPSGRVPRAEPPAGLSRYPGPAALITAVSSRPPGTPLHRAGER